MQLGEAGEEPAARDRHLDRYIAFTEAAELALPSAITTELLDDIDIERDNLRAALVEAAGDGDPERQLRLVTSLRFYLNIRGPGAENRTMVADALARREGASPGRSGS